MASGPMTMQPSYHPDDELLAALADGDADLRAAGAVRDHVGTCERCSGLVDDLRGLTSALAALPDLDPPRPLRLLPPVTDVAASASPGWLTGLRRLTAPVMALAMVLVLAGAVGTATSAFQAVGGSIFANVGSNLAGGGAPVPAATGRTNQYEAASVPPKDNGQSSSGDASRDLGGTEPPFTVPFGWLLGSGVVLLAGAYLVRGYTTRRLGG